MNTRHAQIILTVLRFGSFTAAAKALYITQPTLSQTVKQIETQLGEPIFVRGRTPLELTPAGELYAQAARQIIRIETQLEEAISHMHGKTCGVLHLGLPMRRSGELLPHVMPEFIKLYPDVRIEVTEADSPALCAMLRRHELDMALMTTDYRDDALEYRLIAADEIVLLAGKQTELAQRIPSGSTISFIEAANETFTLPPEASPVRRFFDEQTTAFGVSPTVSMVFDNAEAIKRTCIACNMVTLSPFISLLGDYHAMQKLSHYHLLGDSYHTSLTMACVRSQPLTPYAETLFTLLSNRFRAMTAYRP